MYSRTVDRTIGGYEIVAGGTGIVMVLLFGAAIMTRIPAEARWKYGLLLGVILMLFAALLLAGLLLIDEHPAGRRLSTVMQLLQVPYFVTRPVQWFFFAGAYLGPSWVGTEMRLNFGLQSQALLGTPSAGAATGFGLNLVPFVVLWLLWRRRDDDASHATPAAADPRLAELAQSLDALATAIRVAPADTSRDQSIQ